MQEPKFEHRVSKGSRFNQIYIPQCMNQAFEVGDMVEVKLIKKQEKIFYSKNTKKLGEFKEEVIRKIFSCLSSFKDIQQIFVYGSFLTEKVEYNDIDILIICDKQIEEKVYRYVSDKIQLKFHVIAYSKRKLYKLFKIDPIIRSMLYYFISNKKEELLNDRELDKEHIKFLLMMPEDLLKINAESRAFFDNLRRLLTIIRFLEDNAENSLEVFNELEKLIGKSLYDKIKRNQTINKKELAEIREIIKKQIKLIRGLIEQNEQK